MLNWYEHIDEMIMAYRSGDKALDYFEYKGHRYKKSICYYQVDI